MSKIGSEHSPRRGPLESRKYTGVDVEVGRHPILDTDAERIETTRVFECLERIRTALFSFPESLEFALEKTGTTYKKYHTLIASRMVVQELCGQMQSDYNKVSTGQLEVEDYRSNLATFSAQFRELNAMYPIDYEAREEWFRNLDVSLQQTISLVRENLTHAQLESSDFDVCFQSLTTLGHIPLRMRQALESSYAATVVAIAIAPLLQWQRDRKLPLLTYLKLAEEISQARHDIKSPRDKLVLHNLRFIGNISKKFGWSGIAFGDLFNEGAIGFIKGLERFEPEKGFRLQTFVGHYVRDQIQLAVANKGRTISWPGSAGPLSRKYADAEVLLKSTLGRPPTPEQLAEHLEISVKTARKDIAFLQTLPLARGFALDTDGNDTSQQVRDQYDELSTEAEQQDEAIRRNIDLVRRAIELIEGKDERFAQVLRLRAGIGGENEHSLKEIGKKLGISKEGVRQIELKAVSMFRSVMEELSAA